MSSDTIIFTLVIILLSAFFSGMEIAFVSANKLLFEMDKSQHSVTSRIISHFYANSNNYISTILVGNNIVIIIYGILMARLIGAALPQLSDNPTLMLTVQTLVSTVIIIIAGEFIPKTLFRINPNSTVRTFALPTYLFYVSLYPVSRFTTLLAYGLLRLAGVKISKEEQGKAFSKVELDNLIQNSLDNAQDAGEVEEEIKLFQNVLDFSEIKVRDCLVPRTEIVSISIDCDTEELKQRFIESGHSKILLYKENIDNIIGYIHSSELFRNAREWKRHICKMPIVPETLPAQKMMKMLMQQKKSLAVVVDEFGGTSGIVSLEDIVEEIFGEIEDEHDITNYTSKKVSDNEYLLSARLEIEKINEDYGLDLPESDDYQTLGGMILYYNQSFPKVNESLAIERYKLKIIKRSETKIDLVQLIAPDDKE